MRNADSRLTPELSRPGWRRGVAVVGSAAAALIVATVILVSGAEAASAMQSASGATAAAKTLVIAWPSEPRNLDVSTVQDALNHPVAVNVYEGLTKLDRRKQVVPLLATSWRLKSGKVWSFNLRRGVKFQNGEPFNAAAAVASFKRALQSTSENLGYFGNIKSARAAGKYSLDVTTSAPDPDVPRELVYLMMIPPKYSQTKAFLTHPVGTGPYRFVAWNHGQSIKLSAYSSYWGPRPQVQNVTFKDIPDATVRVQALRAGEVSLARNLSPDQAKQVPTVSSISNEVCMVRLSTVSGPFANLQVRQAANYAVNTAAIISQLFGKFAVPAHGQLITSSSFGYDPTLTGYPYDPAKAQQLLKAAGYSNDLISVVGESAGRWVGDREMVLAVANFLQKAGFNAQPDIREWQLYLDGIFKAPRADAVFICPSDDNLTGLRVLESFALPNGSESVVSDPAVTALITKASSEFNDKKRAADIRAAWKQLNAEAAFIPLASVMNIWGVSSHVKWTPRRDDLLYLSEVRVTG